LIGLAWQGGERWVNSGNFVKFTDIPENGLTFNPRHSVSLSNAGSTIQAGETETIAVTVDAGAVISGGTSPELIIAPGGGSAPITTPITVIDTGADTDEDGIPDGLDPQPGTPNGGHEDQGFHKMRVTLEDLNHDDDTWQLFMITSADGSNWSGDRRAVLKNSDVGVQALTSVLVPKAEPFVRFEIERVGALYKDTDEFVVSFTPEDLSPNVIFVPEPNAPARTNHALSAVLPYTKNKDGSQTPPSTVGIQWEFALLPVQIEVRKQGTTASPETGLLVKKGDVLEFALAPQFFDTEDNFESMITWQYRQLKGDGSYTAWTAFGTHGTGTKFEHTTTEGGIYQIKAIVTNGGEHEYIRKKDDLHSRSRPTNNPIIKKGDADAIGVVETDFQITIRNAARAMLGITGYSFATENAPFPAGSNKCNLFVADMTTFAGAPAPWFNTGNPFDGVTFPPVANQWAGIESTPEGGTSISGWALLPQSAVPQPGYVVAHPNPSGSGHVGVLDYDGRGIGAGEFTVNRAYPFLDDIARLRKH
jgi:hypothetical protein